MNQFLDLEFEFVLFSNLSEGQHRRRAEELHMAAVQWAEERSLGIGGGLRVQSLKGGALSRHRFGLCVTLDNHFVDFHHAQSLFAHLRSMAYAAGCELVGGYHVFPEEEG